MKIAGIVAEYNPFHNGHKYQIQATRQAGAEGIVAVMSGDCVQRGSAAVFSKYDRAQAAIRNGHARSHAQTVRSLQEVQ